ncbi:MAG: trigger factor [Rhodothermales bacterium]|nr:trigger factor [Rhodothermales bacterium]MBO6778984.1 trigger factor [Rhodothermales bacterium]
MPHTITKISDVEFELEVEASAEDIAPQLDEAVRRQRARTSMKGFRPGKVPAQLVRKMYGKALAYGVAEDKVQKTYKEEVLDNEAYQVLGQPTITELDYEYGGDLKAKVRFGVRPEFEIVSLDGAEVSRLEHTISDEEVEEELERVRERNADLSPVEGPSREDSFILTDIYEVDEETGELTGDHRHDVAFFLGSDELTDETRKALIGLEPGGMARVQLVRQEDDTEAEFEVRLKEVKSRELPDLDDDLAKAASKGSIETLDELRTQLRERMQQSVDQTSRELFEGALIRQVLQRHEFEVPESVVDMYVEGRLENFKKQAGDRLPEDFDDAAFMEAGRPDAEKQARWMFIRDRVSKNESFEVSDEDRVAYFEQNAMGDGLTPDFMMQYYRSMPQMMQQLDDMLLTRKVLDFFADQATVVGKDREAMQKEAAEERA